ncbi:hypothetical protein [Virgibacillus halodenitrificans]|uniref:hypothetical protein n=1 Tax=Virgibacillus halodenitrificans TaxID=1482 RepID=UPI000EF46EFB|nr:hypothetical protein [Virgibacillus halodenitrificans]
MDLNISLQESPCVSIPEWANEATHYFENEYGEQWIATTKGDKVLISGLDIGWDIFRLDSEEAIAESTRLSSGKIVEGQNYPLINLVLNESEKFWMLTVLKSFTSVFELIKKYEYEGDYKAG